jgi:catalase
MSALRTAEESVPPNEAAHIDNLARQLQAKIMRDNAGHSMRRDAHPKMHGVVRAEFVIEPDLQPELRVGLFAQPGSWRAWIRFSNQDSSGGPDRGRDIRGMAVKLMGVPGAKLLPDERDELTQDFVLISTPVFVTRDAAEFDELIRCMTGTGLAKIGFFLTHWRVAWNLLRAMRRHANPLQIRYFSTTPYRFGDAAVKYCATPVFGPADGVPDQPDDDYLRQAMVRQLHRGDAQFDFSVQLQTNVAAMPIEDPGVEWPQAISPFRKVATIRIPAQEFDSPSQRAFGENLSFTPWHALPEHRPLGGINRARKVVYRAISRFRHQTNGQGRSEPTGWEL